MVGSLLALVLGSTIAAAAPPAAPAPQALEEVVIGARRYDKHTLETVIIPKFVESHGALSPVIGQLGRWHDPVCPQVTGLQTVAGEYVSRRIEAVARSVGAPTRSVDGKCAVNVEIVFTPTPQALVDHMAQSYRPLLGFYYPSQQKRVTRFNRPIQAWYMTGSRSMNPSQRPVQGLSASNGSNQAQPAPFHSGIVVDSPYTMGAGLSGVSGMAGSHLTKGLTSELLHVLVVADSNAVSSHSVAAISDYIAILTLTRLSSLDGCNELPSIVDLFSAGCGARPGPDAITPADTAFLRALYAGALEANLNIELGEMGHRMATAIEAQP
jgi:hypothetical protein